MRLQKSLQIGNKGLCFFLVEQKFTRVTVRIIINIVLDWVVTFG